MADEPTPNAETENNPEQIVIDPLLQNISYAVNCGGPAYGITLMIKGMLVTGDLISRERYFKEMNEGFRAAAGGEDEEVVDFYNRWSDIFFPLIPEEDQIPANDLDPLSIRFIHLSDAYILLGSRNIPSTGPGTPFRVALSAVDGFVFGRIGKPENA